ncbi:MAG: fibronectin type III protein, partial [uncultured bacterium]
MNIAFNPGNEVTEGYHNFYLRIKSANYPTTDIGIYAAVTQSGQGGILFKCQDIYTGTLNENNQVIQGLTGASIELQHETIGNIKFTGTTDSVGEKEFQNVPAGVYKVKISANEHQGWIGRVFIKPGITAIQEAFLDYNLVTVEWSVNPITIEDKYEII